MSRSPRVTLTPTQSRLLIEELERKHPPLALAAHLMIHLGLRLGEARQIEKDWLLDLGTPAARLAIPDDKTKTGWPRTLPIPSTTHAFINRQIDTDRMAAAILPGFAVPLVTKRNGNRYSARGIQKAIAHAALKTLGFKIRPHALRHTFATEMMKHTNIRVVQAALGHRSIKSTQIYTHPDFTDLQNAIERSAAAEGEI